MTFIEELGISILLFIGGVFVLVGSIGLARLKDLYSRLHAPTKATTLGLGGILLGSLLFVSYTQEYVSVNHLLITLFLVITAPVTAHILAKAAMHHQVKMMQRTRNADMVKTAREQLAPKPSDTSEKSE